MRSLGHNVTALYPHKADIAEAVRYADIVVGAVLITGEKAPHVVSSDMVKSMQPGSVVADISVDQGDASKPPNHHLGQAHLCLGGVTHFTVTNMPGAVPRTSSQALSAAITPMP